MKLAIQKKTLPAEESPHQSAGEGAKVPDRSGLPIKNLAMAFIDYRPPESIPEDCRVDDDDNILRIHSVHPRVMRLHYDLYLELMHRSSPLSRVQREQIAVVVSGINGCHY